VKTFVHGQRVDLHLKSYRIIGHKTSFDIVAITVDAIVCSMNI
jgi:hypothetical protein